MKPKWKLHFSNVGTYLILSVWAVVVIFPYTR